jgi:hypothetical protein
MLRNVLALQMPQVRSSIRYGGRPETTYRNTSVLFLFSYTLIVDTPADIKESLRCEHCQKVFETELVCSASELILFWVR